MRFRTVGLAAVAAAPGKLSPSSTRRVFSSPHSGPKRGAEHTTARSGLKASLLIQHGPGPLEITAKGHFFAAFAGYVGLSCIQTTTLRFSFVASRAQSGPAWGCREHVRTAVELVWPDCPSRVWTMSNGRPKPKYFDCARPVPRTISRRALPGMAHLRKKAQNVTVRPSIAASISPLPPVLSRPASNTR